MGKERDGEVTVEEKGRLLHLLILSRLSRYWRVIG